MVMEGLDIDSKQGIHFGSVNKTKLVEFKKGPDLEVRDFYKVHLPSEIG